MTSLNFPDINVWFALMWERHSHTEVARQWFVEHDEEEFFFCRLTQLGLLRLLTNRSAMRDDVRSMDGAWSLYEQCLADDRIAFLPEPEGLDPRFRRLARGRLSSHNLWADAYLAAFAQTAGLTLVTFDKALGVKSPGALVLG